MLEWHLFNVSQEEALASIDHHGPTCDHRGCSADAVLAMLIKPDGAAWGQQISCAAACEAHRAGLRRIIDARNRERRWNALSRLE